jgi:hypothetical protein
MCRLLAPTNLFGEFYIPISAAVWSNTSTALRGRMYTFSCVVDSVLCDESISLKESYILNTGPSKKNAGITKTFHSKTVEHIEMI